MAKASNMQARLDAEAAQPARPPLALRVYPGRDTADGPSSPPGISTSAASSRRLIACSPQFLELLDRARQVARSKVPILIQGESGTGKELLARLIHGASM